MSYQRQIRPGHLQSFILTTSESVPIRRSRAYYFQILRFSDSSISYSQILRFPDAQFLRSYDSQTLRFPDSQILKLSDSQTLRLADSQTLRLPDSQALRLSDSQTLRLSDSQTLRLPDSQYHNCQNVQYAWVYLPVPGLHVMVFPDLIGLSCGDWGQQGDGSRFPPLNAE